MLCKFEFYQIQLCSLLAFPPLLPMFCLRTSASVCLCFLFLPLTFSRAANKLTQTLVPWATTGFLAATRPAPGIPRWYTLEFHKHVTLQSFSHFYSFVRERESWELIGEGNNCDKVEWGVGLHGRSKWDLTTWVNLRVSILTCGCYWVKTLSLFSEVYLQSFKWTWKLLFMFKSMWMSLSRSFSLYICQ